MSSVPSAEPPTGKRKSVQIVQLPPGVISALSAGDLGTANRLLADVRPAGTPPLVLTPYQVAPECQRTWRLRSSQIAVDPESALWITGVVVDTDACVVVGRAGFHGPPDSQGRAEIGYAVDPQFRRQGYARAALEALLARAASDAAVRVVRASIRPDNEASRALVLQYGFVEVGEQVDDEDGIETIYEVGVPD
jgi:RimJ/RimL family protein N-acetyltransferase